MVIRKRQWYSFSCTFEHKDDYVKYIDDGYEEITNKAFDKIIDDKKLFEQQEIDGLKRKYENKEKELEDFELQKLADDEFKIQKTRWS